MSRAEAVAAAMAEADPSSLGAGERLRKQFGPEVSAWALTQVELRRSAAKKLEFADQMWFTRAGMEQATRSDVAKWRAARFVEAGVKRVWDVGCGIGSDAMAFAQAGLEVVAIDADPQTVEVASHNLALVGAGPARVARAEELEIPAGEAVFLDPARRTARGRTWNVDDFSPSWELVLGHLTSERFVSVKLGPGVPKEILPAEAEWCWVSHGGDVVEASVTNRQSARTHAVRIVPSTPDSPASQARISGGEAHVNGGELAVQALGTFIGEPDGAAIRAGLIPEAVGETDAWRVAEGVAYVSSDEPIPGGWVTNFEVLEVLPYAGKTLQRYVREHDIGQVEIKKRAVDEDPALLRKQLKPKGKNAATIILTPTLEGARAIVVRRV